MEDEEYEIVSSEEVDRLKREIEHLKSNPFIQNSSDSRLYDAIHNLNESVNKLYTLFENVNKQLVKEYQTGESPETKIDMLLEQNKNIAEALLALASKNEQTNESYAQSANQAPEQQEIPIPAMEQPRQIQTQMPPDPFIDAPMQAQNPQMINNRAVQSQQNQFAPQQMPFASPQNQFVQSPQFTQPQQAQFGSQQNRFSQQQMQPQQPVAPSKFSFSTKIDPNYPTPDSMPGLDVPPTFGEPISIEPAKKKTGFLKFGKN